jgi:hypothetical protein
MEEIMKAIIYYSLNNRTKQLVKNIEGDLFVIEEAVNVPKSTVMQMIILGFFGVFKKSRPIKPLDIDFSKYEEIVLATPVWAGNITCFMRRFLEENEIARKKVTLIATCDGGPGKVMNDYKSYLKGNEIEEIIYVKGERI